jgi:hypothetical protein
MNRPRPYSTRTVYWLLAVGVLSFAGAAWFMIYAEGDAGLAKANTFSYSAIGHRALVDTLRETGVPVLVSRADSAAKAGDSSLLVVAEPRLETWYEDTIGASRHVETVLLVLPKWDGVRSSARNHWLVRAGPIPRDYVESILREVVPDGTVLRVDGPGRNWNTGPLGVEPTIDNPQLMAPDTLNPTVWSDRGILVGWLRHDGQKVWIVSDPDILSNHGLGAGDNAVLTLRLIDALRPPEGAVVFDEAAHGYWRPPSLWRSLFQLPFILPVILAAAAIMMIAWAAMGRFGSTLPAKPPFAAGKAMLIDNTASLLRFGGYGSEILRRYADVTLRDVARRLNAPRKLAGAELIEWVDRVGGKRGVKRKFRDLHDRIYRTEGNARRDGSRLARLARRLYLWKREIINGS